jgi:hypothetical protein
MTALSEKGASGSPVYGIKHGDIKVIDLLGVYHGNALIRTNRAFQASRMIYHLLRNITRFLISINI